MNEIIHGDCLEIMKSFPDNHFSCIVTDSPYGISFMGKGWDKGIPSTEYWQEMLRIVKPGGHLIAAGLPRMMHRLISVIEDSGWEVRDLLMHLFGSGFPKSHNHFGLEGYGTALKPAWEGWSLCMKPCDGTFANNAEKWGQAGINVDGCRVETLDNLNGGSYGNTSRDQDNFFKGKKPGGAGEFHQPKGRWPANLLLSEEAAALLDEQSGVSKSQSGGLTYNKTSQHLNGKNPYERTGHNDSGGASRFFYVAKASSRERNEGLYGMELKDTNKIGHFNEPGKNGSLKNSQSMANSHPTVKPLRLMEYLITLIMPPKDGLLLDPFAGSGSTILAAQNLGFNAIGIEKEADYVEIARKRLEKRKPQEEEQYYKVIG